MRRDWRRDGIDNSAGMEDGLGVRTSNSPGLVEGPEVGTGDTLKIDEGRADGVGVRNAGKQVGR